MIKSISSFLIILLLVTSCKGQDKDKISDSDLKKLFEQEKRNEERAKYGNQKSVVTIISNPQEVKKIKNYILDKNKEKKIKEFIKLKDKSLAERYKSGDKSIVPDIIKIIKSNDVKAKKELYRNLSRRYDEPKAYNITEPELIKTILDNISVKTDEKSVIQLAGYMDLPDYSTIFEEYLLLEKTKDINRLIYWLGQDGKSKKALDYIGKLVLKKNFDFEKNDYVMSGLEGFAENGDSESKQKVFDICLEIYNKKLIPKERFEEMRTSWSSANPAIGLSELLLKSVDKRIIPIAHEFLKKQINEQGALTALIKIEGDKHKPLLFEFLKDKDKFSDGLFPAAEMYKQTKDKTIIETILLQLEKKEEHPDYLIDRVVSTFISMNAQEYFGNLDNIIQNKNLIKSLQKAYELTKGTVETIANDLYELRVVDKPFSKEIIEKAKQQTEYDGSNGYIYNFLTESGIYQWFDAETGFVPVDYDNLILEFVKNSNGKLNGIEVWLDAEADKDYNVKYKVYVYSNEKVYTIKPEDIGDWYDVEMTLNLMNTIASDLELNERFVFIDTGDQTVQTIFGAPEKVNLFVEKYML